MFSATVKEILFFSGVWGGFAGSMPWDTTRESSHIWFSLFIFIYSVFCACLTGDSVFYIQIEWGSVPPPRNCRYVHLVGFWVIPQRLWSIHWAQSWSHAVMPSQQCRNRGENVAFPQGVCVGHRVCPFVHKQQNSSGIHSLLCMSEDSWDGSNLGLVVSGAKDKAMINLVCYAKLCFWTAGRGICQWSALYKNVIPLVFWSSNLSSLYLFPWGRISQQMERLHIALFLKFLFLTIFFSAWMLEGGFICWWEVEPLFLFSL